MAKKHRKKTHHRRRRVSGKGDLQDNILMLIAAGVGGLGGAFGVNALKTAFPTAPLNMVPLAPLVGGGAMAYFGRKHPLALGAGIGLFVIGALMEANETVLSVPGISGMANSSNAGPQSNVLRSAVGAGPRGYMNNTVGGMRHLRTVGALMSD